MEGQGWCSVMEINLQDLWQEEIVVFQREDKTERGHCWWSSWSSSPVIPSYLYADIPLPSPIFLARHDI